MAVTRPHLVLSIAALLLAANSPAQQPSPAQPSSANQAQATGSVTGTVVAQDTQRAIRFAQVDLQSVASVTGASSGRRFNGYGGRGGRTGADGTFTATDLAPGDYYVTATALGYIQERFLLQAAVNNGADPTQLLATLPIVHVDANETSNVTVTLQHGAALSGRVVWDDGSAAADVTVTAVPATPQSQQLPAPLSGLRFGGFGRLTQTDDRGDFRISGLPSNDYLLQGSIQSVPANDGRFDGRMQTESTLHVYAPGVFRKSDAKSYSIRVGDERNDVRLTIDLHALRTVSGHLSSSNAGQTIASGTVIVADSKDPSLVLQGAINADGDFTIHDVPSGSYKLTVYGASTFAIHRFRRGESESSSSTPVVTFQPFSQAIVVTDTDLSDFAAALTPVKTQ